MHLWSLCHVIASIAMVTSRKYLITFLMKIVFIPRFSFVFYQIFENRMIHLLFSTKQASPVVGDVRYGMGSGAFIFGLVDDHAAGGWVICVFQL